MNPNSNDYLVFPSGKTAKEIKALAKTLKTKKKAEGVHLSDAKTRDILAEENGMPCGWEKAIAQLSAGNKNHKQSIADNKKRQKIMEMDTNCLEKFILGPTDLDEEVELAYQEGECVILPGEDEEHQDVAVFPHNGDGVLISERSVEIVEKDMEKMGGLDSLLATNPDGFYLNYRDEKDLPPNHKRMSYHFKIRNDGTIEEFRRYSHYKGISEAALICERYFQTYRIGYASRKVIACSALCWVEFEEKAFSIKPTITQTLQGQVEGEGKENLDKNLDDYIYDYVHYGLRKEEARQSAKGIRDDEW